LTYLSTICPVDSVCWGCLDFSCGLFDEPVQEDKNVMIVRITKCKKLFLCCFI